MTLLTTRDKMLKKIKKFIYNYVMRKMRHWYNGGVDQEMTDALYANGINFDVE